jgi:hypothetical protein
MIPSVHEQERDDHVCETKLSSLLNRLHGACPWSARHWNLQRWGSMVHAEWSLTFGYAVWGQEWVITCSEDRVAFLLDGERFDSEDAVAERLFVPSRAA